MTTFHSAGALRSSISQGIGWIEIDNPERHNALTFAMWQALPEAVAALEAHPAVRVIALAGAHRGSFASGADISEFDRVRADAASSRAYEAANADAFTALREAEKPTVAVIRRYCMGGGVGLAAACDIRLAADDASFAIPAARLGLAYPPAAIADVVALVGAARTRDIFYTARRISAAAAHHMGLVDHVYPTDDFDAEVATYLATVAGLAPLTLRAAKAAVAAATGSRLPIASRAADYAEVCFDSADYAEGRAAFRAKRDPYFQGR